MSDDFLKLLVEHRIRILDRLQKFIKDDIGFGRKGGRKGFAGFVSRHTVALNCLEKGCTNAVKVIMKLIDVVTSIFITFGGVTVDGRMSRIDNTLDESNLNVVLIHLEHR